MPVAPVAAAMLGVELLWSLVHPPNPKSAVMLAGAGAVLASHALVNPMLHAICRFTPTCIASVHVVALPLQATLAAANVAAVLQGFPVWNRPDVLPFVDGPFEQMPQAAPSIVNAKGLGIPLL